MLIRGVVVDDAGAPVAEAVVVIASAPAPVPDIAALTDEAGRYALAAPEAGAYTVAATAPDARSGRAEVRVEPDAPETLAEIVVE